MAERKHLIFVNYRGVDERWATEVVYARMTEAFGAESVFKAGNSLRPGEVFPAVLEREAASCPIMLACIGPGWLGAQSPAGGPALTAPDDWVRREIAASLRAGNYVIPVLLGNFGEVSMPKAEDLPGDIRSLVYAQAHRLAPGAGLDLTVPRLVSILVDLVPELAERRARAAGAAPQSRDATTSASGRGSVAASGNSGIISTGNDTTNIQFR